MSCIFRMLVAGACVTGRGVNICVYVCVCVCMCVCVCVWYVCVCVTEMADGVTRDSDSNGVIYSRRLPPL